MKKTFELQTISFFDKQIRFTFQDSAKKEKVVSIPREVDYLLAEKRAIKLANSSRLSEHKTITVKNKA